MNSFYTDKPTQPLSSYFQSDSISADTQAVNDRLLATLAKVHFPEDLNEMRQAYTRGQLGVPALPKSPRAVEKTIAGPAGPLQLRILVPDRVRGVYLHIHGGGWLAGSNDTADELLEMFGREAGLATVSVNYRLAPEHPFPAPLEDCVAAALWLADNAQEEFGVSWLSLGGESAGANLAASTLVRLRDLGRADAYKAANLLFGCYDLSLTPSVRAATDAPFVNRTGMERFVAAFAGSTDLRDPGLSPLYADLRGLPPALFSVGTVDPLLDDSLFMNMRWQAAGNTAELAVYPGGTHGFNLMDGEIARTANLNIARFLDERQYTSEASQQD